MEDVAIEKSVSEAFKLMLVDQRGWHPEIPTLPFGTLDSKEAAKLEEQFPEEDIFATLFGLNGDITMFK